MTAVAHTSEVVEASPGLDRLRRIAALLAVTAIAEAVGLILLAGAGDSRFGLGLDLVSVGFVSTIVLFPVMGALIAQRRPTTRVAWLMIVLGLGVGFGLVSYAYGVVGYPPGRYAPLPLAVPALVVSRLFFIPCIGTATTWILLLYPTDRLLAPRWRWVGIAATLTAAVFVVATLVTPGFLDSRDLPGLENPLGVQGERGAAFASLAEAANVVGLVLLALAAGSLVVRYTRADAVVRAQIRWLALVASLAIGAFGVSLLPVEALDDLRFGLGLVLASCMPIAIGIAITRYRLYDIDRLINRALVYGSLTAILAGVFTAGVGLAQRLFVAVTHETSDAAVVGATLVVATLYAPLRKRLEGIVDRRFKFEDPRFGVYRDELTKYLGLTDFVRASQRLVREAVGELDAAGGAVLDAQGRVVASAGIWPADAAIRLPLAKAGSEAGTLVVGPRLDGRPHDERAVAMLDEVAILAAAAIRRGAEPR